MSKLRIAVWDPLPVYRQGLITILDGVGHPFEEPPDLITWASKRERRVVVMTVKSAQDWVILRRLGELDEKPVVVALLNDLSVGTYVRALSAGAVTTLPRSATPDDIRQALLDAVRGRGVLPTQVIAALVARFGFAEEDDRVSERDIEWLRALSQGTTVAELAKTRGYSERAMYRLLRNLYQRIGVSSRTEAVLKASQSGWI